MFLSDSLEQIMAQDITLSEKAKAILKELVSRIPNPSTCSVEQWIDSLKCIDNSYRHFCKQHEEFKVDAFRNFVLHEKEDDTEEQKQLVRKFRNILGW